MRRTAPRTDFAIGTADDDPTDLRVMRLAGWAKATRYRITLLPSITDTFGRGLILPEGESQGVFLALAAPEDGTTPPSYARVFPLAYDKDASDTLAGAFPGGQTSLFQGTWTDPVTGLAYHRARWYDPRNATWLSPDPLGEIDSTDLYAFAVARPTMGIDPESLYEKDFHFYAVYYLARVAGFSNAETVKLAWASQYVDDHPETSPVRFVSAAVDRSSLRAFHFLAPMGGVVVEKNYIAIANAKRAQMRRSLVALGVALHSLADTFAHAGFSAAYGLANRRQGGPILIGHADLGHLPDFPFLDVPKALRAARAVYSVLEETSRQSGHTPMAPWSRIEERLTGLFGTWGSEDDRVRTWKNGILRDLAATPDYSLLIAPADWVNEFLLCAREQRSFVLPYEALPRQTTIGSFSQP